MNKSGFFQKIGKLTFSVILTGVLVTGAVIAATTFTNGDILDATDLNNAFDEKLSVTSIPTCGTEEYLTTDTSGIVCKKLTDNTLTQSDVLNTITSSCKVCVVWSDRNKALSETTGRDHDYGCTNLSTSAYARIDMQGDVGSDDQLGVKVLCSGGTWSSTSTNITSDCGSRKNTTVKSGMCFAGDSHVYYTGEQSCRFMVPRGSSGEPMMVPGFKYSKKYTQRCN